MSDELKHECGVAMIRLLKPLEYYQEKYGTSLYGLNKMYLLMQKQVNRGQDGAGLANIKLDVAPGKRYISRYRSNKTNSVQDIFTYINKKFEDVEEKNPGKLKDVQWLKENVSFSGELFLGHLRYGTYGGNSVEHCHPFLRQNNWMTRNLVLAGNFNMTNVDELFDQLIDLGQHPKEKSDTVTILEKIGHFLDEENDEIYYKYKDEVTSKREMSKFIASKINVQNVLANSAKKWDGGYVMCGLMGHGDAFALRDPAGIRPGFYYKDDEIVVVASERAVIQTAMNVPQDSISEITPGHALIIKKDGRVSMDQITEPLENKACSFERIYFSRGNDADIYTERKELGKLICPKIMESIGGDLKNSVFSFIPNTAETSFYGMVKGMEDLYKEKQAQQVLDLGSDATAKQITEIFSVSPRIEKIAIKDAKLRTFITDDSNRDSLVGHVYDITYGQVSNTDNLVMIDDSIVRGTTLKKSILKILDRLNPKKIVVVSSAPQIRYPDCYGIDMARMGDFIAFRAAIALLKDRGMESLIEEIYQKCKAQIGLPKEEVVNYVKGIYNPFTPEEISAKCVELLKPEDIKAEVEIIFQGIDELHQACPNHKGDWYFTGDYPTPGGNKVVNKAFMYYVEGNPNRAY
ncbi:MAG: amidophosphoribosyltransferase [Flavobacteriales bacterium]|jgi:amidophosphoribosyltransferase|tara:strand:- start:2679 stop:4577 length:1899 start_codon:yes stop_codon:yes gene_type:complete